MSPLSNSPERSRDLRRRARARRLAGRAGAIITMVSLSAGASSCSELGGGLRATPEGEGPQIRFDLGKKPIPELPLPNDIATRPDPSSPTGLRLNASMLAVTDFEATLREKLDRLSGWGTSQPLTLSFDAPLDLDSLLAGHRDYQTRDDGRDYVFDDDVIFLVDVTEGSPTYGKFTPLDFGDGNFPDILRRPDLYFEADPNVGSTTLLGESFDEDRNGNGRLDPGEDIDMDGWLDRPNAYAPLDGDPALSLYDDVATFYDFSTNTLIARPLLPMRGGTTYAVVVTERLLGHNGQPVRSPFPYINHTDQTEALQPAVDAVGELGIGVDEIAFAWTFTTQDVHHELLMIRDGLYGAGPMSWLAEEFPPVLKDLHIQRDPVDTFTGEAVTNPYIIPGELLHRLVEPLAVEVFGAQDPKVMEDTHRFPAYHVSGTFETPYFLDLPGEARWNGVWPADLADPSMRERVGRQEVSFWCTIPRWQYKLAGGLGEDQQSAQEASSPVAMIGHGYTLNRLTHLGGFSTNYNKFGITGCEIEAPDHGLALDQNLDTQLKLLTGALGLSPLADILRDGRARDIDGDGVVDSGDTWFGADGYRIRDSFRQSALDYMVMLRVFRHFDGERRMPFDVDGDGDDELAGDFDGDGHVDFGGDAVDYFASGESLGGIMSSILAGIEPKITAAAPISGGAALTTLALKTEQGGAYEPFSLQVLGPAWIGERDPESGGVRVYQLYANGNDDERTTVAWLDPSELQIDDIVRVTNLTKDESHCARVLGEDSIPLEWREQVPGLDPEVMVRSDFFERLVGSFRVALPADRGDRVRIEILVGHPSADVVHVDHEDLRCEKIGDPEVRRVIDTWEVEASYQAGWYSAPRSYEVGDPLRSLEQGIGFKRAHHLARKAINLVGVSVEAGDPVNYAPYYSRFSHTYHEGDQELHSEPRNVLDIVTVGDPAVPVSLGVHIARAAGFLELQEPDPRWGKTPNRTLIDSHALEAITFLDRFPGFDGQLMDVDNYSNSTNVAGDPSGSQDGFHSPRLDPPLRAWKRTRGKPKGLSGLSLPMPEANGAHVFVPGTHSQTDVFDVGMFMSNLVAWYFRTGGEEIRTEACMQFVDGCDWLPEILAMPEEPCTTDEECATAVCEAGYCAWVTH